MKKFIIAVNENDEFPKFLYSGKYEKIDPSRNCISSAMNVGHPSNLSRVVALYRGVMDESGSISRMPDMDRMQSDMVSYSISDVETEETIRTAYRNHRLILEPHGSVGWAGLMRHLEKNPDCDTTDQLFVSLETAHPAKFPEEIEDLLHLTPEVPESLSHLDQKEESYIEIDNDYSLFHKLLNERYAS